MAITTLTEDQVRDKAREILSFEDTETAQSGVGQLTSFKKLGFVGRGANNRPDGWYLPHQTIFPAIILEVKNEETELKTREKQNANLQAKLKIDPIQYEDALHIIYVISEANLAELETIYRLADRENKKLIEKIVNTINNNRRIFKLSDLSLNYDYGISMKTPKDLVEIVRKYVNDFWLDQIAIKVETSEPEEKLICNFDISKISLLVDNFISNSKKAKAKNVNIQIKKNGGWIVMRFSDDGVGLDKSITNVDSIFERGYSTTFGFGLGLYHAKKVVTEMRGTIQVIPNTESGFALEVAFKYECKF